MRHRITALTGAVIAGAVVNTVVWAAPAAADVEGFNVRVTAPDRFTAGRNAQVVTAVVTSENRQCRKVRWALLVHSRIDPGQLQVTRFEDNGPFATTDQTEGVTTTIVDNDLDPGEACRGRTVTGRWQVGFAGPEGGDVRFEVRAFDAENTLLTAGGAAARVRGEVEAEASPSATPEESAAPEESEEAAPEETREPTRAVADPDETETALVADDTTLLGPGLIVGGVCVFLGVLLLVRLRARARQARQDAQSTPTGFYRMPG
ncbi:hypothetical protein GCM10010112_59150 [Actinoplanes lobatus]|uniref:Uncharacterized protein n=1 Tax=Actinoplanes lobatus TaxID=113568 RepID=A0A7W7HQB4_9ACTN|nr:hypothetical protein [Actinoplanes lobatus]MBB4754734.1 hypothetical protein [Actinoplanes lobatus]GGN82051.1 hypothetical protein GCM10010112_59150 [Actinoplanes lobatus]GIE43134.1 hypothetical protein Alo02nite_60320 [Actinoplanes lobatus]